MAQMSRGELLNRINWYAGMDTDFFLRRQAPDDEDGAEGEWDHGVEFAVIADLDELRLHIDSINLILEFDGQNKIWARIQKWAGGEVFGQSGPHLASAPMAGQDCSWILSEYRRHLVDDRWLVR